MSFLVAFNTLWNIHGTNAIPVPTKYLQKRCMYAINYISKICLMHFNRLCESNSQSLWARQLFEVSYSLYKKKIWLLHPALLKFPNKCKKKKKANNSATSIQPSFIILEKISREAESLILRITHYKSLICTLTVLCY